MRGRGAREAPGADEDDRGRFVDLARAVDAIEHQKAGRAAGKVVVEVVRRGSVDDEWDGMLEMSPRNVATPR